MRYPDGGGLSAAQRARREAVRLRAAAMFEEGVSPVQVARELRVSIKSAYQWRRRWRAGGDAALAAGGPGGAECRLSAAQLTRLAAELDRGPAAHGWAEDQRWTLARVATLIGRLFHVRYTLRGVSYLLHRTGFSPQVPVHRPPSGTRRRSPPGGRRPERRFEAAAATRAWVCFEDEVGQTLRPPKARTWGRRGQTPVVTVSGKGSGRLSVAGLACYRPGARSRLFYRIRVHRGRAGERRSMSEADYAELVTAAHTQLTAPVILIWDYVARHIISSVPGRVMWPAAAGCCCYRWSAAGRSRLPAT